MNTVNIFSSLRCLPEFNPLLRHCVDIIITRDFQIRVLHIPGEHNAVADAISRREFLRAQQLVPGLQIQSFKPPHLFMLGAAQK
jgi:hypothetical protein